MMITGGMDALNSYLFYLHRDFKTDNVLLAESGQPCIADLGLTVDYFNNF